MRAYRDDHRYCEVCGKAAWKIDIHHKFPHQHEEHYDGDVNEDANLVAVCRDCHKKWGSARFVGDSPNPNGTGYAAGYARLVEAHPQEDWSKMAPDFVLEAYEAMKGDV